MKLRGCYLSLLRRGLCALLQPEMMETSRKFPASSGHVLSVGALTKTGQSSNLNPNDNIDVFAIGENVIVPTSQRGKIQRSAHGTSYAAPMVAGLLSLLMQYAKAVPQHRDDIDRRLHNVSFLKVFFKDHKLCDNRKLV